jgi:hypothetical protein
MDIHNLPEGTTAEDVAKAHAKDMETQRKYGVEYHKYWVNETGNKVFCLVDAPNAEAAECVHREAHGLLAEKIIEVEPDVAEVFLGGTETNNVGAVLLPGGGADARDPGIRTILFTDIVNSTTLTQSLGDEAALAILGMHDTIVRDALSALADARSSTRVTASWHPSCQQQVQFDALFRFSANWTSTRKRTPRPHSRFESAPQPVNLSNKITISLDRQFNSPPGCAPTHRPNKSW